ncbi:MAG: cation diffusion facilitator family transporter [Nocardioides sp.]
MVIAFALISGFFAVELGYGLLSGSLALLSDAGHMAADVVALGGALLATQLATRVDRTGRRTFGSYRAEVFASGFTVLLMLGVSGYVVVEALRRSAGHPEVQHTPMVVIGVLGLVVNVVVLLVLRAGARESLNVRAAYSEVVADTAGSLGVLVAGLLVWTTGRAVWDSLIAVAIGAFVAIRALGLGREVLAVLGQHAPADLDIEQVARELGQVGGVSNVHDLHVWTLTSGMLVATAHLVAAGDADRDRLLDQARGLLQQRHGIAHATLQIETAGACDRLGW